MGSLQKQIWRTVGSLLASCEPLAHHRNVTSLSLFCSRYYFVADVQIEPAQLFHDYKKDGYV